MGNITPRGSDAKEVGTNGECTHTSDLSYNLLFFQTNENRLIGHKKIYKYTLYTSHLQEGGAKKGENIRKKLIKKFKNYASTDKVEEWEAQRDC